MTIVDAKGLHNGQILYHKTMTNADGTPLRARVNGQTKLWKTRPEEFRVPMKHGMYDHFYLEANNSTEWSLTEGEANG
jgi:hypothetical protein